MSHVPTLLRSSVKFDSNEGVSGYFAYEYFDNKTVSVHCKHKEELELNVLNIIVKTKHSKQSHCRIHITTMKMLSLFTVSFFIDKLVIIVCS